MTSSEFTPPHWLSFVETLSRNCSVVVRDAQDKFVFLNELAYTRMGYDSAEPLLGTSGTEAGNNTGWTQEALLNIYSKARSKAVISDDIWYKDAQNIIRRFSHLQITNSDDYVISIAFELNPEFSKLIYKHIPEADCYENIDGVRFTTEEVKTIMAYFRGYSHKEIARMTGVSHRTVGTQLDRIANKLEIGSVADLMLWYRELHIASNHFIDSNSTISNKNSTLF